MFRRKGSTPDLQPSPRPASDGKAGLDPLPKAEPAAVTDSFRLEMPKRTVTPEPADRPDGPHSLETPMASAENEQTTFRPEVVRRPPDLPTLNRPPTAIPAVAQPGPAKSSGPHSGEEKRLTVGRDIFLSGEIKACDKLVVEGRVEATLTDSRTIEVTQTGSFTGSAEIDEAVIAGLFEGTILVRGRLLIRATGKVKGEVRYGQIQIECGGEVLGKVDTVEEKPGEAPLTLPAREGRTGALGRDS